MGINADWLAQYFGYLSNLKLLGEGGKNGFSLVFIRTTTSPY